MLKVAASGLYAFLIVVTFPLVASNPLGWAIGLIGIGVWLLLGVWVMSLPDT